MGTASENQAEYYRKYPKNAPAGWVDPITEQKPTSPRLGDYSPIDVNNPTPTNWVMNNTPAPTSTISPSTPKASVPQLDTNVIRQKLQSEAELEGLGTKEYVPLYTYDDMRPEVTFDKNTAMADIEKYRNQLQEETDILLFNQKMEDLRNVGATKEQVPQEYDKVRNQISAQSQINQKDLATYMAARGINPAMGSGATGAGIQAQINSASNLQRDLGEANLEQQRRLSELDNQELDIVSQYNSSAAEARSRLASDMLGFADVYNRADYEAQAQKDIADRNLKSSLEGTNYTRYLNEMLETNNQKAFDEEVRRYDLEFGIEAEQQNNATLKSMIDNDKTLSDIERENYKAQVDAQDKALDNQLNQFKQYQAQLNDMGYTLPTWYTAYDPAQLAEFSGDYQAAINSFIQQGMSPSDPVINMMKSARFDKIMSDPTIRSQYGEEFRTLDSFKTSADLQNTAVDIKGKMLANAMKEIDLSVYPDKVQMEFAKLAQDLDKGAIDIQTAQTRLQYLPASLQADLDNTYSTMSSRQFGDNLDAAKFSQGQYEFEKEYQYKVDKDGGGYYEVTPSYTPAGLASIVIANEGDYGTIVPNDNGGFSIGKGQWHNERGGNLLNMIYTTNPDYFNQTVTDPALKQKITSGTGWAGFVPTHNQKLQIQKMITSAEGVLAQDNLILNDMSETMRQASNILSDPAAQAYASDIIHQYGVGGGPELLRRAGVQSDDDLATVHQKVIGTTSEYKDRRITTFEKLQPSRVKGMSNDDKRAVAKQIESTASTEVVTGTDAFGKQSTSKTVDRIKLISILENLEATGKYSPDDLDDIAALAGYNE